MNDETIAAIATPPGRGGVGIIRVSGPAVTEILQCICKQPPAPRKARLHRLVDANGDAIDDGLLLFFPGPDSFTGEDVLEFQGHGGPVVMDMALQRFLQLGARVAMPGEFTQRAFLNDKLDLAQAEAVADLIDAGSKDAARAATRSLEGEFSRHVNELASQCLDLRMHIEAAIDFPEEEIDFLSDTRLLERMQSLVDAAEQTLRRAHRGRVLRDGIEVVLAGEPNVGKSSLMNAIAGRESAIVTDVAGTTRDMLREYVEIEGLPVHLVDTAGLRESSDVVEAEGIRRATRAMEQADIILAISDAGNLQPIKGMPTSDNIINVHNKIDLLDRQHAPADNDAVCVSAKTGEGMSELLNRIRDLVMRSDDNERSESDFTARTRHVDALQRFEHELQLARSALFERAEGELAAEHLRYAHDALGSITGKVSADELLGEIFSRFCIGK
ncbi:MAG: tRNA uridine-5-carboxymethylaminomethyl(34) synthesis GTPase MnmE [Gammaproteobacteria bacterium]|nr:tRNA uridine-5-carboxymethylaminomethyl(34) synthesis GTPase MnmE [Gammaproteobacteria bacterium]